MVSHPSRTRHVYLWGWQVISLPLTWFCPRYLQALHFQAAFCLFLHLGKSTLPKSFNITPVWLLRNFLWQVCLKCDLSYQPLPLSYLTHYTLHQYVSLGLLPGSEKQCLTFPLILCSFFSLGTLAVWAPLLLCTAGLRYPWLPPFGCSPGVKGVRNPVSAAQWPVIHWIFLTQLSIASSMYPRVHSPSPAELTISYNPVQKLSFL